MKNKKHLGFTSPLYLQEFMNMIRILQFTSRTSCQSLRPSWRVCWCSHQTLPSFWWLHRWRRSWILQSCDLRVTCWLVTPPTVLNVTCGLVNLGHVDLDTGVVLGRQDAVAGRAFPGNSIAMIYYWYIVISDISSHQYSFWVECRLEDGSDNVIQMKDFSCRLNKQYAAGWR